MRPFILLGLLASTLPAAAAEGVDPACTKQVNEAFAKLRSQKSFRLETSIKNDDGLLNLRADYVLPDRMHQTVTLGKDGPPMELIVIGTNAWSNQGSGWAQLPENFAQAVAKQLQDTIAAGTASGTEYTCLGEKDFEGHSLLGFQGALPMPLSEDAKERGPRMAALSIPKIQSIYIDKHTGLPLRNIVTTATDPDKRLFDGTFSVVDSLVIDQPKIEPPPAAPATAPTSVQPQPTAPGSK